MKVVDEEQRIGCLKKIEYGIFEEPPAMAVFLLTINIIRRRRMPICRRQIAIRK